MEIEVKGMHLQQNACRLDVQQNEEYHRRVRQSLERDLWLGLLAELKGAFQRGYPVIVSPPTTQEGYRDYGMMAFKADILWAPVPLTMEIMVELLRHMGVDEGYEWTSPKDKLKLRTTYVGNLDTMVRQLKSDRNAAAKHAEIEAANVAYLKSENKALSDELDAFQEEAQRLLRVARRMGFREGKRWRGKRTLREMGKFLRKRLKEKS